MADIARVRALLHEDRPSSLYALGDLDARRSKYCDWYVRGRSVALVYREFDTPILLATGATEVLADVPEMDACLLHVPERFLAALEERFELESVTPVLRMSLDPGRFSEPADRATVEPLGPAHEGELRELYGEGLERGEEPDFFMPVQLGDDTFFGVREDGRLVAAGGTHLYSATESIGAVGNVYTRRSHRGRGLAAAVVSAIVERLIARRTATIGLNVRVANTAAIRLYERLGFKFHARFLEGRAITRRAVS
jgi:ribosomal protein S18 acetylase RimI-like enzyme